MDNVVTTFPLLRLPNNAILNTIRIMTHLEIFGISILSKKSKNLVESSKVTATATSVFVDDLFEIHVDFCNNNSLYFELYQVEENEPIQELETPENLNITTENQWVIWTNVMSVKELLDHLQFIFHSSTSELYFGLDGERFSFESIHKTVKGIETISLTSGNHEQNRRILNLFQPIEIDLFDTAINDGHIPRYISIQNFDRINLHSVQIDLDDLLMINARSITLKCDKLSVRFLNRFVKLWMKGSNSRLECVKLEFPIVDFQIDDELKKLNHKVAPLDRLRLFKSVIEERPEEVIGGWDIWRLDGTQATITSRINEDLVRFELFVWHDHCNVN